MTSMIAKVFYYAFHPLLIYGWLIGLCIWGDPFLFGRRMPSDLLFLLALVLFSTAFIPGLAAVMMKTLDLIQSHRLIELRDRIIPLTATAVFYMAFYSNVDQVIHLTPIIKQCLLGILITLFVLMFLSPFYQPSVHGAGHMSLLFGVIVLFYAGGLDSLPLTMGDRVIHFYPKPMMIGLMMMTGFMGSYFMKYRECTLEQILSGWMLGVMGQAVAAMWFG